MTRSQLARLALVSLSIACGDDAVAPPAVVPPEPPPLVAKVRQLRDSAVVFPGMYQTVSVDVLDASSKAIHDRIVTWTSSNPAVARVTHNGDCGPGQAPGCYRSTINGIEPGTTIITATADGISSSMVVRVAPRALNTEGIAVRFEMIEYSPGEYAPQVFVSESAGRDLTVVGLRIDFSLFVRSFFCTGNVAIPAGTSQTMFDDYYGDYQLSFSSSSPRTSNEAQVAVFLTDGAGAMFSITVTGPVIRGEPPAYRGGSPRTLWQCG